MAFNVAQSLRPNNIALQSNIATLYLQMGDEREALQRYGMILQQDSTVVQAWLNMGLHFARSGDKERARRSLRRALELQPDNALAKRILQQVTSRE